MTLSSTTRFVPIGVALRSDHRAIRDQPSSIGCSGSP
jgi:hypothetical protein